ncbi:hypothetical protein WG66_005155, partial [Moniliophthora roreri]
MPNLTSLKFRIKREQDASSIISKITIRGSPRPPLVPKLIKFSVHGAGFSVVSPHEMAIATSVPFLQMRSWYTHWVVSGSTVFDPAVQHRMLVQ